MMQRLVTVLFSALFLVAFGHAAASEPELYLIGLTIEATPTADEDSRGDILEDPKKIRILNLGKVINHKGLDYGPTISADGKTLYYVSNRPGSRVTRDGDFSHDFWSARKANNLDTVFGDPKHRHARCWCKHDHERRCCVDRSRSSVVVLHWL